MLRIKQLTGLPLMLLLAMAAAPWSTQAESGVVVVDSSSSSPITETNQRDLTYTRKRHCRAVRLRECEYDCNNDCDCQQGLVCYRRDNYTSQNSKYFYYGGLRDYKIPGCSKSKPKNYHSDYCIDPQKFPTKTLWYAGSGRKPTVVYPLKECWGDCDADKDWYVIVWTFRSMD
jgi:hypothetical protein